MSVSETQPRTESPLKQARKALGLRLVDVAAKAHCSVSLVSMMESGYVPALDKCERVAVAVGGSLGSFFG